MPSFKPKELWDAQPHTLAKIAILRQYLVAWFAILGRSRGVNRLVYIDGFAGPGEYKNSKKSSPLTAMEVARDAINRDAIKAAPALQNLEFVFLFVEKEEWCVEHLRSVIQQQQWPRQIKWNILQGAFEDKIGGILRDLRSRGHEFPPTFAFIDPFGATGLPFDTIEKILSHQSCEVLLNLDSDGVGRLFTARNNQCNQDHLTKMFGDDSWMREFQPQDDMPVLCRKVLALYKKRLRTISQVRYVFAFQMNDRRGLSYHLVFASQHPLGLEKMKEAMESVDKSGSYSFSHDTSFGQTLLFDFRDHESSARQMQKALGGVSRPYADFNDFALNETPFRNPKKMLVFLKKEGKVRVTWLGEPPKHGFPEEKISSIVIEREADQLF